ncbi:hypothetical protein IU459_27125 [Nocardia amamiensis]|uniref:Uncharacterized protein n=1 Tax=Nocardia amamiensis TaxID=404578 RepID=A0ABS0CX76_9NOCA|nr:hypothetical protein [Nocardia amamiensis]MBF6301189.1 hypothetical protein [Nocardia amamiensis]
MNDRVRLSVAAVRDARLSFRAKGVLALLIAAGGGEEFTIESIAAAGTEEPAAITTALQELLEYGYLARQHQPDGQLSETEWLITDTPDRPEPS